MKTSILFILLLGLITSASALNPSRTYKQRPEKFNMRYKEVKVPTSDGARLNAWYFTSIKKTTKCILILHNGEGNMADYMRRVDQLKTFGNVVIFDYRGYGESSDFEIDENMYIYPHFIKDVQAMLAYCELNYSKEIVVYGWGIGAGLGLGVGYNTKAVKQIIADTPFLSMEDLEERFDDWEEPMEVPFAGYSKKEEPLHALDQDPSGTKEILLMAGSNDILFKPSDYDVLVKKQKKLFAKETYVIENPDRKDNFKVDKAAYISRIKTFLEG